jgi:hypothetical protein
MNPTVVVDTSILASRKHPTQKNNSEKQPRKNRTSAAAFAKAKPVGLVSGSGVCIATVSENPPARGLSRLEPPVDNARSSRDDIARQSVSIADSPIYLFQAEPDRPGSFVPLRKDSPDFSQVVIGQIANERKREPPQLPAFGVGEFDLLGMGRSTSFPSEYIGGLGVAAAAANTRALGHRLGFEVPEAEKIDGRQFLPHGLPDDNLHTKGSLSGVDRDYSQFDDQEPPIPTLLAARSFDMGYDLPQSVTDDFWQGVINPKSFVHDDRLLRSIRTTEGFQHCSVEAVLDQGYAG